MQYNMFQCVFLYLTHCLSVRYLTIQHGDHILAGITKMNKSIKIKKYQTKCLGSNWMHRPTCLSCHSSSLQLAAPAEPAAGGAAADTTRHFQWSLDSMAARLGDVSTYKLNGFASSHYIRWKNILIE